MYSDLCKGIFGMWLHVTFVQFKLCQNLTSRFLHRMLTSRVEASPMDPHFSSCCFYCKTTCCTIKAFPSMGRLEGLLSSSEENAEHQNWAELWVESLQDFSDSCARSLWRKRVTEEKRKYTIAYRIPYSPKLLQYILLYCITQNRRRFPMRPLTIDFCSSFCQSCTLTKRLPMSSYMITSSNWIFYNKLKT